MFTVILSEPTNGDESMTFADIYNEEGIFLSSRNIGNGSGDIIRFSAEIALATGQVILEDSAKHVFGNSAVTIYEIETQIPLV